MSLVTTVPWKLTNCFSWIMENCLTLEKPCSIMADCRDEQLLQKKKNSPERCSGVKNKSNKDFVFGTGSWNTVKESSIVTTLMARQAVYSDPDKHFLQQLQKLRRICGSFRWFEKRHWHIFTNQDIKGDSPFETALKPDQNWTMVQRQWRVALI